MAVSAWSLVMSLHTALIIWYTPFTQAWQPIARTINSDQGRLYDQDGNMEQWWSNISIAAFTTHAQCFIDQYDNFSMLIDGTENHVNGVLTLR